jgi:hypothetical protein
VRPRSLDSGDGENFVATGYACHPVGLAGRPLAKIFKRQPRIAHAVGRGRKTLFDLADRHGDPRSIGVPAGESIAHMDSVGRLLRAYLGDASSSAPRRT